MWLEPSRPPGFLLRSLSWIMAARMKRRGAREKLVPASLMSRTAATAERARRVYARSRRSAISSFFSMAMAAIARSSWSQLVDPILAGTFDFVIGSRARGQRESGSMKALYSSFLPVAWPVRLSGCSTVFVIRMACALFAPSTRGALESLGMREKTYGWNLEMQMRAARQRLRILGIGKPSPAHGRGVDIRNIAGHICCRDENHRDSAVRCCRETLGSRQNRPGTISFHRTAGTVKSALHMSVGKSVLLGLLAGLVAGIAMTVMMLVWLALARGDTTDYYRRPDFGVYRARTIFLSHHGRVGGYNHHKQLGVGSTAAGQLLVSALGGAIFAVSVRRENGRVNTASSIAIFVLLPLLAWPSPFGPSWERTTAASHQRSPACHADRLRALRICLRTDLVNGMRFLTEAKDRTTEFTPSIGRRAVVLGGLGLLLAGGGTALVRKLYRAATFSYDGTQYKGRIGQAITPNDQFYCVTKNIIDPRVDVSLWHLEINGLVQNPRTYRLEDLKAISAVERRPHSCASVTALMPD